MKKILLLVLSSLTFSLFAQSSLNMTLLGQLPYPGNQLSNLWGYVAPDSTEYAIIGTELGVSIVSLADPTNPTEVQFLPGIQTIWREVKTFSTYAYISNEGGDGLRIIDLSGLPSAAPYKDTVIQGVNTIHSVSETDGYLYLNGTNMGNKGFDVLDLNTDPWHPTWLGRYDVRYVHDCYVRGNTMYAGQIYDGLFTLIDVTNKANCVDINTHSYPNSFTHNTWLNDASDVCFTTDEKDEAYVYAWDISDPMNIQYKDKIRGSQSAGLSIPHNIHVLNDYGVTSYYKDGVVIFDVSHPNNMVEVGYYDTSPATSGGGFAGCWGVYPYLPSGNIIASDIENGLYVIGANYIRACYLEGKITDANTTQVIQGANVDITFTGFVTEQSDLLGDYHAGVATTGTYTVTYSKAGYVSQTLSVSLSNGATTTQDVQLVPLPTAALTVQVLQSWGTYAPINGADVFITDNNGLNYSLTSGANGMVTQNVGLGNYDIFAGKWGYVTKKIGSLSVNATSNITIYLNQGYYDDFYFDNSWQVSGAAPRGKWERGEPVGTQDQTGATANPENDVTTDIGDQAFVTGNGGGNVGDDDVDNGSTILTSPVMDLSTYTNPLITYNWWMYNKDLSGQGTINDHYKIEILNGTQTVQARDYTGLHNQWNKDSILVSQFVTPSANIRIRLTVTDTQPGHVLEGAFDKMWVKGAPNIATKMDYAVVAEIPFQVFPNPFTNMLTLQYENKNHLENLSFDLVDVQGKVVQSRNLPVYAEQISINTELTAGIYFAKLKVGDVIAKVIKVVKE